MFDKAAFGQRLREIRSSKSLKLQEVGEAIGSGKKAMSNIELGRKGVSVETLVALAEYFDVSADYLLGLSEVIERR